MTPIIVTTARPAPVGKAAVRPIPKAVFYALVATLVMFEGANTFGSTLTAVVNATKWVPLGLLLVLSLSMFTGRRVPQMPPILLISLLLFMALTTASAFSGIESDYGAFSLFTIVLAIMTGYALAAVLVASDSRRAFFDLIGTIGRVMVVTAILFFIAGINWGRGGGFTGGGFAAWTDNPNTLASMLAPGTVVFMAGCIERRPGWKLWHLSFLIVSLPLLWATNGRASILWVGFSAVAFWLYRRGSWATVVAAMAAMVILIGWWEDIIGWLLHFLQLDVDPNMVPDAGPLSGREEVWRIGAELIWDRPMLGYGIGSSKDLIGAASWRLVRFQGLNFHSSYIMLLIETGLLGFLAFMTAMISTLVRGIAEARRTQVLPRESWPLAALPFVMVAGALGHAIFEAWLVAAGNVNSPIFWTCVWLVHFQSQIPINGRVKRSAPGPMPDRQAPALPTR